MKRSALRRRRSNNDRLFETRNPFTAVIYKLSSGSAIYNSSPSSLLFLFLFFVALPLYSQSGWFWQYPKLQGNRLWDVCALDEDTVLAGGLMGTLMRSTNGGTSWMRSHYVGNSDYLVSDFSFINQRDGWVSAGTCVLETHDGAESWSILLRDSSCGLGGTYLLNQDTGWVYGRGVILRTSNRGELWDTTVIVQWDDIPILGAMIFTEQRIGWCVGFGFYGNEVYRTTDMGKSWEQVTEINPRIFGAADVRFVNQDTGWIVSIMGQILKTTDAGITWTYQKDVHNELFYSIASASADTAWVVGVRGTFSRIGLVYFTTDGGQTWTRQDNGILEPLYSVTYKEGVVWAAGEEGCIYKSTDYGTSWIALREPLHTFKSIHFANEDNGWAVGEKVIFHSSNGGDSWVKQCELDSLEFSSVHVIDTQNAFVVGSIIKGASVTQRNGVLVKTTDQGHHWVRQDYDTLLGFNSLFFIDDSTGWITGPKVLLKTTNRGLSWQRIADSYPVASGKIQFVNRSLGWAKGSLYNTIYLTEDGGTTWSGNLIDSNMVLRSFHFVNSTTGWAVGDYNYQSNIFKTTDGGRHWSICSSPQIADYLAVQFVDENKGWIIGDDYLKHRPIIYATTDGGNSWIDQKCVMQDRVMNLFFLNETTGWVVGRGILKTDKGIIGSVNDPGERFSESLPRNFLLFQNYPNPFNPATIIKYKLDKSQVVSLRIFDLLGRHVETLVDEKVLPGEYTVKWDASGFTSGVYFYRLQVGSSVETKKMVLIR